MVNKICFAERLVLGCAVNQVGLKIPTPSEDFLFYHYAILFNSSAKHTKTCVEICCTAFCYSPTPWVWLASKFRFRNTLAKTSCCICIHHHWSTDTKAIPMSTYVFICVILLAPLSRV